MSKNITRYQVIADDVVVDTRTKKDIAINKARDILAKREAYVVRVVTEATQTEVFKAARRRITKITPPYTKVIDLPQDLRDAIPFGYVAAYARYRNGAVVLRLEDDEIAEDPSLYAVLSTDTKEIVGYRPTTRAAGALMKAMGLAKKEAVKA